MTIRIPRNLLVADRVALGLTRGQLLTIAAPATVGYGCWRSLDGTLGLGAAVLSVGFGLAIALVRIEGSPLMKWLELAARWLPRRRQLVLEWRPC
jgi:hypothetical protein